MFIPLYDHNPVKHIRLQWVTLTIIVLNVLAYLLLNLGPEGGLEYASVALGHIPSVANNIRQLPADFSLVPDQLYITTTITSAFLHADIWHLAGNMLFIWVFGDNVEDALGHFRFVVFYLACCFAAAWFHAFTFPQSDGPLIGASGAASGLVAAYLILHPKTRVWVLFLSRIPIRLPALYLLLGWILYQGFMFLVDSDGQISWAAHVGGITAGIVLVVILKRSHVPLFDRDFALPDAVELEEGPNTEPATVSPQAKPQKRTSWGRDGATK